MKTQKTSDYATRDNILKLLSDEEIARVSTSETSAHLVDGDEYVDLEELQQGVRVALGDTSVRMGRVLPRKAVLEKTWQHVMKLLSTNSSTAS